MKAVLDACVLYPTVLREILTGAAAAGLFAPVWSPRLLTEWRHAAARLGPDAEAIAGAEAALLNDRFPGALVAAAGNRTRGLDLPDPADAHVIEAALESGAGVIVTANLGDFPRGALSSVGLRAEHPDAFLLGLWLRDPDAIAASIAAAQARAEAAGGALSLRELLKRARLPRLSKALAR